MNNAQRLKSLRVKKLLSREEFAAEVGLSIEEASDLEQHASEMESTVSVGQVLRIAAALGVEPWTLLAEDTNAEPYISPQELADSLADYARDKSLTIEQIEEQVGWELGPFLRQPTAELLASPAMFVQDIAALLKVSWLAAIPR